MLRSAVFVIKGLREFTGGAFDRAARRFDKVRAHVCLHSHTPPLPPPPPPPCERWELCPAPFHAAPRRPHKPRSAKQCDTNAPRGAADGCTTPASEPEAPAACPARRPG